MRCDRVPYYVNRSPNSLRYLILRSKLDSAEKTVGYDDSRRESEVEKGLASVADVA